MAFHNPANQKPGQDEEKLHTKKTSDPEYIRICIDRRQKVPAVGQQHQYDRKAPTNIEPSIVLGTFALFAFGGIRAWAHRDHF